MSSSRSFSLVRFSSLVLIASSGGFVACAGTDVPLRPDDGIGATGGSQTASNGGSSSTNGGSSSGGTSSGGTGGTGSGGSSTAGTGGADDTENGGSGGGSDCDGAQVLITNCGSATCHGGGIGTFAKDEAAVADAVGQASASYGTCGSGVLIDPSDSTQGVIFNKISGGTCGPQMPLGGMLTDDDKACIESFLADFEN
jgi:hypothetical protein